MSFDKKIMVVDDDPDILLSIKMIFENKNYKVITANNGRECLEELKKGFEGVIILDIMMPVLDGIETIKKMVVEGFIENNKIIVLTVKKIQGEEFDDIYQHIDDYIQKPFDVDYIIKTVSRISD